MSINLKAYKDADGNIFNYVEGGTEDVRAEASALLERVPGQDKVISNDETTDETPVTTSQIVDFDSEAGGAAPVQSVAGKIGNVTLVKGDVGLGNVDNTSDADKPVSTAQQAEIDLKYDASNPNNYQTLTEVNALVNQAVTDLVNMAPEALDTLGELADAIGDDPNFSVTVTNAVAAVQANLDTHINDLANPHATTKAQVGLGNVDNTSDADKPVSTAQQAALDLKSDLTEVYTRTALDGGQLDNRYYTEGEIDTQQNAQDTNISNNASAISTNAGNITQNANDIAQEITDRTNADAGLQSQITNNDTDIAQNAADIAQEILDRTNADINLQGQITANANDIAQEITDRTNADAGLQSQITINTNDIAQEITDRTNADSNLQSQITSNDGDISTIQGEQVTQDAAIALNTAKVSADGSIDTHSDVDTTTNPPGVADLLRFNGTNWVPDPADAGYTIFGIWAEENTGLSNNNRQWSFGNGATGAINIVLPIDAELFAISFDAESGSGSVTIDIMKDDVVFVTSKSFAGLKDFETLQTPQPFSGGECVGFRTNTISGGSITDARVCAWFRVRNTPASTSVLNDLLDVSTDGILPGQILEFNGSNYTPLSIATVARTGNHSDLNFNDGTNPHSTTFSDAVAADPGTDITPAEAEELTNGSRTILHDHTRLTEAAGTVRVQVETGGDVTINNYPQDTRNNTTSNDEKVLTTDNNGTMQLRRVLPYYAFITKVSNDTDQVGINQNTTLETYLLLNFTVAEAGVYEMRWFYEWSYNGGTTDFVGNIVLDGGVIAAHRQEPKDTAGTGVDLLNTTGGVSNTGTDQRHGYGGMSPQNLTAGAHTLLIQWAGSIANEEAAIYRGNLSVTRVQ